MIEYKNIKTIGSYYHWIAKGGAQRVVVELIWLWKKMGYEVILFTDEEASSDDYNLPKGIKRVILQSKAVTNERNYSKRGEQLEKAICEYKIDLMVYHEWDSPLLSKDMSICKLNQTKFIIYCHSIFTCLLKGKQPVLMEKSKIFNGADGVITLNQMDTNYWNNYNHNVIQVLNPVYIKWENIKVSKVYNKKLLWMGRLVEDKNPIDALKIMEQLVTYDPEIILYMLVDSVRSEYTKKILNIRESLGLENNVIIEPFCKDITPYLEKCSIYLMTSKIESFSLTLQETQCYGMPCVMYELPYLTMTQNKEGIVDVSQGDIQQAAKKIIDIAENIDVYKTLNLGARNNIEKLYGNNNLEVCWQNIFQSLQEDVEINKKNNGMRYVLEEMQLSYKKLLEQESHSEYFSKRIYANLLTRDIVLFGTGRRSQAIKREYPDLRVNFYLDNNRERSGKSIDGCEIRHPDQIKDWKKLFIIIAIVDYEGVKRQLEEQGLKYGEDFVLQQDILEV